MRGPAARKNRVIAQSRVHGCGSLVDLARGRLHPYASRRRPTLIALAALLIAAAFAGAAVYVAVAEHPARLALDDAAALAQWKPSYRRGKLMQASLALAGGLLALWVWWQDRNALWLIGGLLLLANWPATLILIMPVNRRLEAIGAAGADTRALLVRWGRLHLIRAALGTAAALVMFCAFGCRL